MSGEPTVGRNAWGILGGTFDPVHYAHLAVAEQTRERLGLRGVLFVPAAVPPHKPGRPISAARHRLAMVELAVADNSTFRVSRIELDRPGPSYTVDTVAALLADPPSDIRVGDAVSGAAGGAAGDLELVVIVSIEALGLLPDWHEPLRLLDLCRVAVVPRRGHELPARDWFGRHFPGREARFIVLDGPDLGHSASAIRESVRAGRSIRYLVPPPIERYIRAHGLYAGPWPAERPVIEEAAVEPSKPDSTT
jgi:nicotinate-nucleotide adenylyltransferase